MDEMELCEKCGSSIPCTRPDCPMDRIGWPMSFSPPPPALKDKTFLVIHKCRGEATIEVALRWEFGTPFDPAPWWILQSTGNRIYPYYIGYEVTADVEPPPDHRDFYQANPSPSSGRVTPTSKYKTAADLL
jgi:hypothetical protein